MAKVLENFLIGIGLDTEKYDGGAKKVEDSLGRMRSLVGITGAAITGAFASAGLAAINAGQRIDRMNLEFQKFRTPPQYIYDYGNAIRALGGNADEATAAIGTAESRLASFRQTGQFAGLEELQMAGLDMNTLVHENTGQDFMRELARQIPNLSKEQQLRVQETLGLSDAVMRSLRGGLKEFDASIDRAHSLAGNFDEATQAARDFNKELGEFGTRLDGIGNTLAQNVLPGFTGLLKKLDGFLDSHKEEIGKVSEKLGENPTATALMTGGGAASAAGVALRGIGLGRLGLGLSRLGYPGMVAGGAMMAWDTTPKDIEDVTGYRPSPYIFDKTPLDATRDAYNYAADKFGLERSEKGSGAIDYLEGSYGRLSDQVSGFDSYLQHYAAHKGKSEQPGPTVLPNTSYLPLNRLNENPIYAGGEVSNTEAADANPSVVMVKDQRQQAEKPPAPQKVNVQNHLDVNMTLDGYALDHKIDSVVQRRESKTSDDIQSSVDR